MCRWETQSQLLDVQFNRLLLLFSTLSVFFQLSRKTKCVSLGWATQTLLQDLPSTELLLRPILTIFVRVEWGNKMCRYWGQSVTLTSRCAEKQNSPVGRRAAAAAGGGGGGVLSAPNTYNALWEAATAAVMPLNFIADILKLSSAKKKWQTFRGTYYNV